MWFVDERASDNGAAGASEWLGGSHKTSLQFAGMLNIRDRRSQRNTCNGRGRPRHPHHLARQPQRAMPRLLLQPARPRPGPLPRMQRPVDAHGLVRARADGAVDARRGFIRTRSRLRRRDQLPARRRPDHRTAAASGNVGRAPGDPRLLHHVVRRVRNRSRLVRPPPALLGATTDPPSMAIRTDNLRRHSNNARSVRSLAPGTRVLGLQLSARSSQQPH